MLESLYYTSLLFKVSMAIYAVTTLAYLMSLIIKEGWSGKMAFAIYLLAFLSCTLLIGQRWLEAGRPPFKSFYESLVFAIWTTSLVSLIVEYKYKVKLIGLLSSLAIIGIFLFTITKRDVEIIVLPPALQTWIFIPHVVSYFLAYGALFVGGLAAILHLVKPGGVRSHHSLGISDHIDFGKTTYEIIKIGFLFLTAGLLLGAWWGQIAWSNYWGWDPKENWALITWLIFAAYLHFRNLHGFSPKMLSWIVIFGVAAIIFTYLGMEYLPTADDSLHVYSSN
jgi:cytochrome c-type biogenesis protein CcsB